MPNSSLKDTFVEISPETGEYLKPTDVTTNHETSLNNTFTPISPETGEYLKPIKKQPDTKQPTVQPSISKDIEKDKDPRIEGFQKFMETAPLGIVYNNPKKEYGVLDQELIESLKLLESKLVELTGNYSVKGRLVYGNAINFNTTPQQLKYFIDKISKDKVTKTNNKVIEFKKYLKSINMYNGDVESEDTDSQFISALQSLEKQIAKAIGNDAIIGLIWQGNGINPQTSPEDIQNALNLIKKKKSAINNKLNNFLKQSGQLDIQIKQLSKIGQSLDTFEVNQENDPIATKTVPSADDMNIVPADPAQSQQIGKGVDKLPKVMPTNQIKRLKLLKMLSE